MNEELGYRSLLSLSQALARAGLSPVEATQALLRRIEAINPKLNAYLSVDSESALAQAKAAEAELRQGRRRGPLHGVPIAIKDLFHVRGEVSTFGAAAYKSFVADRDATIVQRLKAAGAVILGKLHLHEGAFGGHHPDFGRCLNPWNRDYWPGGSSSGSGAATAAGLCFASLGTDTGGSIRFPSAACGVTGLKVTWGRTSREGAFPLSPSLDTIGPMARSAADAAAMLDAFAGPDPLDPTSLSAPPPRALDGLRGVEGARGMRIGVDAAFMETGVDPETVAALRAALDVFARLGAELVPVSVPDRADALAAQLIITDVECARFHAPVFAKNPQAFGPELRGAIERGLAADPIRLASAYIARDRFKGEMSRLFARIDALISPIYPVVGLRYDEMDAALADLPRLLGFTSPFNVSGSPSLTMPCGLAAVGMPIGLQLIGPHLSEAALLRLGHAYQTATDWHLKRPKDF